MRHEGPWEIRACSLARRLLGLFAGPTAATPAATAVTSSRDEKTESDNNRALFEAARASEREHVRLFKAPEQREQARMEKVALLDNGHADVTEGSAVRRCTSVRERGSAPVRSSGSVKKLQRWNPVAVVAVIDEGVEEERKRKAAEEERKRKAAEEEHKRKVGSDFPSISELNPFPPASRMAEIADELLQSLHIDNEQHRRRIEQEPQGTQSWLDARKYRLTASNFGKAAGHNRKCLCMCVCALLFVAYTFVRISLRSASCRIPPTPSCILSANSLENTRSSHPFQTNLSMTPASFFAGFCSPAELAREMLHGESKSQNKDAMRWGSEKKPEALAKYVAQKRAKLAATGIDESTFSVIQSGLHVCAEAGWLAASPNGHVQEGAQKGLLQIRCPYKKKIYDSVFDNDKDQVQGLCAILGYEWADFVVWTPEDMKVRRIAFDSNYWHSSLRPALVAFYRDQFLPAYVKMRMLELGEASGDMPAARTTGGG